MRSAIVSAIVAAIVAAPAGYSIAPARSSSSLEARVAELEENERGDAFGVRALIACARNGAGYGVGRLELMSHELVSQCLDDYYDARARAEGVDH